MLTCTDCGSIIREDGTSFWCQGCSEYKHISKLDGMPAQREEKKFLGFVSCGCQVWEDECHQGKKNYFRYSIIYCAAHKDKSDLINELANHWTKYGISIGLEKAVMLIIKLASELVAQSKEERGNILQSDEGV